MAFLIWLVWPLLIGAQWIPTSRTIVTKMLDLTDVHEGDVVIDLGSGDGRIIITAAEEHGAMAIGIEADPIRLVWSRMRIRHKGLSDRVRVLWGNFFDKDLGEATVVTVYQNQATNRKLIPKFERELKPGTRVISYVFPFFGWEPTKVDRESHLYLYAV
jgi:cyclopropane fatty-acyl-phospholipid synthase-like methyltransferase